MTPNTDTKLAIGAIAVAGLLLLLLPKEKEVQPKKYYYNGKFFKSGKFT